jgi:hypothetical protein
VRKRGGRKRLNEMEYRKYNKDMTKKQGPVKRTCKPEHLFKQSGDMMMMMMMMMMCMAIIMSLTKLTHNS